MKVNIMGISGTHSSNIMQKAEKRKKNSLNKFCHLLLAKGSV
jgi:hypothetical protein